MNRLLRASAMAAFTLCVSAAAAAAPATRAEWSGAAARQLQRHLTMPKEADGLPGPLSLKLRLTILPDGGIDKIEVAASSGHAAVDRAAAAMVRRAGPLPAFAADMTGDREILMLPLRFELEAPQENPPAAAAHRYADPARGYGVTVPAPYRILPSGRTAEFDLLVRVGDATGERCTIGFNTARKALTAHPGREAPLSAAARLAADEILEAAQGRELQERRTFESAGAHGVEYVAPAADAALLRYTALLDTPALRVALACTATRAAMPAALADFRRIRDGISLGSPDAP